MNFPESTDLCLKIPNGKTGENSSSLFETLVSRGKSFSSEAADLFLETDTFTSEAEVLFLGSSGHTCFSSEAADLFSEIDTFTSETEVFSWEAVGTQVGLVVDAGNLLRNHP